MAMIVPKYERSQIVQAQSPVGVTPARPAIGQLAQGLSDIGTMFDQWQADVDEADAKGADTDYAKLVRDTLYNPETGYLNASGGSAMTNYKQVSEALQRGMESRLAGMSPKAREMAQRSMQGALEGALLKVDAHAGRERLTYLDGQSKARAQSAIEDAILDPANFDRSLGIMRAEVQDQARRGGWSPEQTEAALRAGESDMHAGLVSRLSNVDPQQALDYLNTHRDKMSAEAVVEWEKPLVQEAKLRRGRDIGVEAARGAYVSPNQIGDAYYASIRQAESGGNDSAINPKSTATGRYQFIQSTWDGLRKRRPDLGLTSDGRLDPEQQERAIRAFTEENADHLIRSGVALTNGTLYAAHFLGSAGAAKVLRADVNASMADLVGPGVMSANPFLRGMNVGDFIAWAEKKGGSKGTSSPVSASSQSSSFGDLLMIEDPDMRDAAIREYQLWSSHAAAEQKAAQDAAMQQAFMHIEQGGAVDDLPMDVRGYLGMGNTSALRTYEDKRRAGPIQTDPGLYVELTRERALDPQAFASRNPLDWRGSLSDSDFKSMVDGQTDILSGKGGGSERLTSYSTITTVTDDLLKAAGIDGKSNISRAKVAIFKEGILRWDGAFRQQNGRAPTHEEIFAQGKAALTDVIVGDGWVWDTAGGAAFHIDFNQFSPEQLKDGRLKIGDTHVTPESIEIASMVFALENGGVAPTQEELIYELIEYQALGYDLTMLDSYFDADELKFKTGLISGRR